MSSEVAHWERHEVQIIFCDNICRYVWLICFLVAKIWRFTKIRLKIDLQLEVPEYQQYCPVGFQGLGHFSAVSLKEALFKLR